VLDVFHADHTSAAFSKVNVFGPARSGFDLGPGSCKMG
jgi:hypothetical protein